MQHQDTALVDEPLYMQADSPLCMHNSWQPVYENCKHDNWHGSNDNYSITPAVQPAPQTILTVKASRTADIGAARHIPADSYSSKIHSQH